MRLLPSFAGPFLGTAVLLGLLAAHPALASGPVEGWPSTYATEIAVGSSAGCAIQAGTGVVVCWGDDSWGEATPPASVNGTAETAKAIAAARSHSVTRQSNVDHVGS